VTLYRHLSTNWFVSLLNPRQGFGRPECLYPIITVIVDSLPANTKNRKSTSSWTARVWFLASWAVRRGHEKAYIQNSTDISHTATHLESPQTHCTTLQHHCNTLQHIATQACIQTQRTPQCAKAATHCNTLNTHKLQHTATPWTHTKRTLQCAKASMFADVHSYGHISAVCTYVLRRTPCLCLQIAVHTMSMFAETSAAHVSIWETSAAHVSMCAHIAYRCAHGCAYQVYVCRETRVYVV